MQTIIVDMTPGFRMPTIYYSQGDVGTQFAVDLRSRFGDSLPAGATVTIQATKPSGFGFSEAATSVTNGVAVFTTVAGMTDEAGRFPAELKVTSSGVTLFTANFYMNGEASTHPEGTIDGSEETVIPELTQLVERVETAASSVLDMTVEAETLAAGSQATYSYDEDTNTATFGIPQGEAGAGAAGVTASAYSSSRTYAVGEYVIHNSNLYRCTTAITTAEAFTAAHWTQVVLADDVTDLKSDFGDIATEFITLQKTANVNELYSPFVLGELNGINIYSATKYRIVTKNIFTPYEDVKLIIDSGFQIGWSTCDAGGTYIAFSGWKDGEVILPTDYRMRLCVKRATDVTSEVADIVEFTSAIKVSTVVDTVNMLADSVFSKDTKNISDVYGNFVNASLDGINLYTGEKYRCSSNSIVYLEDYYSSFKVANGFKLGWSTCDANGTFIAWSGWQTGIVDVETPYRLRFSIARVEEDITEIADVNEFVSAITIVNNFERTKAETLSIVEESLAEPILLCERAIKQVSPYIAAGQSACSLGEKYVTFNGSENDHSNTAAGHVVDITEQGMTEWMAFTHNLGHCASADYNEQVDTIVVCDGVYESKTPNITIIEDATNVFVDYANIDYADYINISFPNLGYCGNAVFGADNSILYIITKRTLNEGVVDIYKLLLGLGNNDYSTDYGTFISGKGANEYNGTAKLIGQYVSEHKLKIGTLQDSTYKNGKIYVMTGGPRINGLELCIRDTDFVCTDSYAFNQLRHNGDFVTYEPEGCLFVGGKLVTWAYHNGGFSDMPLGLIFFD